MCCRDDAGQTALHAAAAGGSRQALNMVSVYLPTLAPVDSVDAAGG